MVDVLVEHSLSCSEESAPYLLMHISPLLSHAATATNDRAVQFLVNSIIYPDFQRSWQGKQVLGPIDGRK